LNDQKKHTGVKSFFNQYFVKTNIVSRENGKLYNRLSDARQEGDYIDFVYYTSEDVSDWIQEVKSFIEPCAGKLARTVLRGLWGWQQPPAIPTQPRAETGRCPCDGGTVRCRAAA